VIEDNLAIDDKWQVPLWKACEIAVQQGSTSASQVSFKMRAKMVAMQTFLASL
jgi:hypothetical protein